MAKDPPLTSVKDAVYRLQISLVEGIRHEKQLFAAGSIMSRSDYEDVVTERSIANLCGYPICTNSLPPGRLPRKGRYRISLKEHKVYDLMETRMYCSSTCVVNSKAFAASLKDERCAVSEPEKISELLDLFGKMGLEEKGKKGEVGLPELKILEKADVNAGEVSLEEWIGPSNAIEGYVPLRDRTSSSLRPKLREKGSKPEEAGFVKGEEVLAGNDTDFTSTIIIGNPSNASEASLGPKKYNYKPKVNKKLQAKEIVEKSAKQSEPQSKSSQGEVLIEEATKQNETQLKSALKSSGVKPSSWSVTWADEKEIESTDSSNLCNHQQIEENSESIMNSSIYGVDDGKNSLRFALAEACAIALSQAAGAVASGESDAGDAVTEAGIVILPPPVGVDEVNSSEVGDEVSSEHIDVSESENHSVKWPKKPVLLDTDAFDSEDSWHDTPPEGFSLTLSPFATMWMALFGWITTFSLAYIYGRDESSNEEFLFVNGREYPHKILLSDGPSSEIKQTLAGCIARSLPGVVADLRLPTPLSFLEQFLGRLLDTMSFVDPLPPFRTRQWQVIVILFIDALSVCRIPALAQHMTNKRMLLHKMLDAAQVGVEEYEIMKDYLIPLGRQPEFSAQSGG